MADDESTPAGTVSIEHHRHMFDPEKMLLQVLVHPSQRGRGIGSALFEHGHAQAVRSGARVLRTWIGAASATDRQFAEHRGFAALTRTYRMHLDLTTLDAPRLRALGESLAARAGIDIRTLRELERDEGHLARLYELETRLVGDVPAVDRETPPPYDRFVETLTADDLVPDAYLVAIRDGAYVGQTSLWAATEPSEAHHGLTGVRRELRRLGVARALKIAATLRAIELGYRTLTSDNDDLNVPMIALNRSLGFWEEDAFLLMEATLPTVTS